MPARRLPAVRSLRSNLPKLRLARRCLRRLSPVGHPLRLGKCEDEEHRATEDILLTRFIEQLRAGDGFRWHDRPTRRNGHVLAAIHREAHRVRDNSRARLESPELATGLLVER